MTRSIDLHPVRWRRTRPFSTDAIAMAKRGLIGVGVSLDLLQNLSQRLIADYKNGISRVPSERRPKSTRILGQEASLAATAARWFCRGRNAFVLSEGLVAQLTGTDLDGVRLSDIQFPYPVFYLSFAGAIDEGLPGSDSVLDGAYVAVSGGHLEIHLSSRRVDCDPNTSRHWPFNRDLYFYVPLDMSDPDATFSAMFGRAISSGAIKIDDDGSLLSEDEYAVEVEDRIFLVRNVTAEHDADEARANREALPAVQKALALVANTLAYLTAHPEEVTRPADWTPDAPEALVAATESGSKAGRERATAQLLSEGFVRVKLIGRTIATQSGSSSATGTDRTTAHWRRGHWRRQPHGEKAALRRLIWIRPTLVRSDLPEQDRGRIYEIEPRSGLSS